jgi:hypothetical protein
MAGEDKDFDGMAIADAGVKVRMVHQERSTT